MQFLYARVSTSDQTAAHQLQQAHAAGFHIDEDNVIKDEGVSGISTCFAERDLLATDSDIAIAKQVGLDRLVVRRIRQDPAKAEAALTSWEALKGRQRRGKAA
jgi:hypothetical protein